MSGWVRAEPPSPPPVPGASRRALRGSSRGRWSDAATVGLVAAAILALAPTPARSAARPDVDLVVSSTSTGARETPAGRRLTVTFSIRNVGRVAAGRFGTRFYLSADRRADPGDFRLAGGATVRRLGGRRTATGSAKLRLPRALPLTTYFLLACTDAPSRVRERSEANNCRAAGRPLRLIGGSSFALIESAVRLRRLSREQGLALKVFALFGDRRLPAAYRGDGGRPPDNFMDEVALALPRLSESTRAILAPFFVPPSYRASSAGARTAGRGVARSAQRDCPPRGENWTSIATGNGKARVWWDVQDPALAARAQALAQAIDSRIWPKLAADLKLREPLADDGVPCFNGGDGRLDVYLVTSSSNASLEAAEGAALAYLGGPAGCKTPKFLLVNPGRGDPLATLTHEVFHAFQAAYASKTLCYEREHWWNEATATWAEEFVWPERTFGHCCPGLLLPPAARMPSDVGYSSWVFPYYLAQKAGAHLIRTALERSEQLSLFPALNASIPGGFAKGWADFALHAWNQAPIPFKPVPASFAAWDKLTTRPSDNGLEYRLGGQAAKTAFYFPFLPGSPSKSYSVLSFPDSRVRQIEFDQPAYGGVHPKLAVAALVRLRNGTWRHEDWTNQRTPTFCRDRAAQDVTRLVLIYSWASYPPLESKIGERRAVRLRDRCAPPDPRRDNPGRVYLYEATYSASGNWHTETHCENPSTGKKYDLVGDTQESWSGRDPGRLTFDPRFGHGFVGGTQFRTAHRKVFTSHLFSRRDRDDPDPSDDRSTFPSTSEDPVFLDFIPRGTIKFAHHGFGPGQVPDEYRINYNPRSPASSYRVPVGASGSTSETETDGGETCTESETWSYTGALTLRRVGQR